MIGNKMYIQKNIKNLSLFILFAITAPILHAEIIVELMVSLDEIKKSYVVEPGGFVTVPLLGKGTLEDTYSITITKENSTSKDITAYLVDEDNLRLFIDHSQYHGIGFQRASPPFNIRSSTRTSEPHYLVLDNTYDIVYPKKINISIKESWLLGETQRQIVKTSYESLYESLKKIFVFPDFDIYLQSCGQANAYSDSNASGNIHICTELVDNSSKLNNAGALIFIFYHELAHSLLGIWGLPGNNNEDIADEFATYIM